MSHGSLLSCCLLETKSSANQDTVTHICGPEQRGRHTCFDNQLQESLVMTQWIMTRGIFLILSLYMFLCLCFIFLFLCFLSPISPVCRASSNNKVKEMVMLELSYVNSNLQLLMGQLEGLNSSVEVYQNTQYVQRRFSPLPHRFVQGIWVMDT